MRITRSTSQKNGSVRSALSRPDIAQFDLGESSALTGFDMLDLDCNPEPVVMADHVARANGIAVEFHIEMLRKAQVEEVTAVHGRYR